MREHFKYPDHTIFLNSGSMALSPVRVLEQVAREKINYESNPTLGLFGAWERMWAVQKKLAGFFKADPRHLFLRPNVTYVMNDLLMALQLPPKSEILISDIEYGAVVRMCAYKAETENHSLQTFSFQDPAQASEKVTEAQILERFESALRPETKLVMLSHVMTGSGLTLPIEKMAALLRTRGIFFAVDGAHGAGACDLDFSNTQVDFYGTNLHKWLMGPKGTGFGYVSPFLREHLRPRFAGWTTGKADPHFEVFGEGDTWTSRWMICSTHNFSDFYGIPECLNFWSDLGARTIRNRQSELRDFARTEIEKATGWICRSSFGSECLRGPMLAFRLPADLSVRGFEVMKRLQTDHQITVSMTMIQNEWHLRISPHVYNTEDEITRAAKVFATLS